MNKKKIWVMSHINKGFSKKQLSKQEMFLKYLKDTESDASFSSYERYLRKVFNDLISPTSPEVDMLEEEIKVQEELPFLTDTQELIRLLNEEVSKKQQKLNQLDLHRIAQENGFNTKSFSCISDLKELLRDIYIINHLEFENDIDNIKLKRKLSVLQSEVDELKNRHADYSQLVDILETITEIYSPWEKPELSIIKKEKERAVVALFSDIHAGELVSFEETHGLNEYNQMIMKDRIDSFFNQIIDYAKEVKSDVFYLKMLGDMINGEIHEELTRNSDLDTTESLILVSDYISQWIKEVSKFFKEVHVLALSGNHGRFSKKPNFKKKNTLNFDYIAYEFIRRETKNIVKSFDLPDSPYTIRNIMGSNFFSTHGDIFKGGSGLLPASGTWVRDLAKLKGTFKDYTFEVMEMGHFHTAILDFPAYDGSSIIVNGSVKGADEFSLSAVKKGESPAQVVYTVEKNNGIKFLTKLKLN